MKNIEEVIKVGQKVKAKIITLDINERRIGLSMKALEAAPAGAEKSIAGGEAAKVDKSKEADLDVEMDGEEKKEKKAPKKTAKKADKE